MDVVAHVAFAFKWSFDSILDMPIGDLTTMHERAIELLKAFRSM